MRIFGYANPKALVVDQTIVIPGGGKIRTIEVNGYAMPTTSINVIRKIVPSLTYLSISVIRIKKVEPWKQ